MAEEKSEVVAKKDDAMETFKIDLEHDLLNDALLRGVKNNSHKLKLFLQSPKGSSVTVEVYDDSYNLWSKTFWLQYERIKAKSSGLERLPHKINKTINKNLNTQ
ncbi:hypothetical protein YC2023_109362 [Brassica napus]